MAMDRTELQKLRDLPIEGVAERLGLRVVRHKSLCPFHDDHHASMSFHVRRNTFRCFVCGASGGTIDLVMRRLNKGFLDACRWLADEHGVILEEWKPAPCPPKEYRFDPTRYEQMAANAPFQKTEYKSRLSQDPPRGSFAEHLLHL